MSSPSSARAQACTARPGESHGDSTVPNELASENRTLLTDTADLISDTLKSTPTHNSRFRTGRWLPAIRTGQVPGYLICGNQCRHYFDAQPMQVHAYTSKHIPAFVTAPDRIYQSNATSRTDFAQRSMAGMLPTDCR